MARHGFWLLAPIWLSAGVVTPSAVGFAESGEALAVGGSLAVIVPSGLLLAAPGSIRRLRRLGYRRGAG